MVALVVFVPRSPPGMPVGLPRLCCVRHVTGEEPGVPGGARWCQVCCGGVPQAAGLPGQLPAGMRQQPLRIFIVV